MSMTHRVPVLGLFLLAAAAQAQVTILPQGYVAKSVSADGQVVVGLAPGGGLFRWTPSMGVQSIPGMSGLNVQISDDGQTVVADGGGIYRWTQATGAVQIASQGIAPAVSADGSVIAYDVGRDIYRWTSSGTTQIPTTVPGADLTLTGISADGSTIIGGEAITGSFTPYRWTAAGGATSLGSLPGAAADAYALAVSADGNTVYGPAATPEGGYDTFRWTPSTGMQALGVAGAPPNIFTFPNPYDATADGEVIVGDTFGRAFFWRMGYGPGLLKSIVEDEFGFSFGLMHPHAAWGISADGRTIVGSGILPTGHGGFIVHLPHTIPAPGTAALGLACAGVLARRRRRTP